MQARAESSGAQSRREYSFGPRWLEGGGARFLIWAPAESAVQLRIAGQPARAMTPRAGGWHQVDVRDVVAGARYAFELDDGTVVPDPASRFQPDDVHGWSELLPGSEYPWSIPWRGRLWEEMVIYELHVGTFTPQGTFLAAIEKLDHLAGLGITAIEIMPVADFPGTRNWGYDGVFLYAPDASYGRPDDLRALVDAAHERGIAVLLDVVYNHFGPDGNYLPRIAPAFFTERHHTPWGAAINFDGADAAPVREFFVQNALYWLREFHIDGLRLDAVHAIRDDSELHLLDEIAERARREIRDRPLHLILENEENETRQLIRQYGTDHGRGREAAVRRYTAQWNDDIHHVLHVAATGESAGYYGEYLGDTHKLARAIAEGFAFQGEIMQFRGRARGSPSKVLPPSAFVSFLQNHDQVGNRAFGDRIGRSVPPHVLRAVSSVYLLAPQVPMLFMGEEWNARQPFQFFCDFHGELADAVRKGRREEFSRFPEFADARTRDVIPDPQDSRTFEASKLRWEDCAVPEHAAMLRWFQRALDERRARIVPLIREIHHGAEWQVVDEGAVFVRWDCERGRELRLSANLSAQAHEFPHDDGLVLWHEGEKPEQALMAPWSVRWTLAG
ncbi:MAG TPA: malto-oligosyltrehalose trehalohydrolase [Steroidobacteraceae bacterium]|nr:malto-oligosyltrehalose trehalohydrolase [Steroidobacteraceae bacterium]